MFLEANEKGFFLLKFEITKHLFSFWKSTKKIKGVRRQREREMERERERERNQKEGTNNNSSSSTSKNNYSKIMHKNTKWHICPSRDNIVAWIQMCVCVRMSSAVWEVWLWWTFSMSSDLLHSVLFSLHHFNHRTIVYIFYPVSWTLSLFALFLSVCVCVRVFLFFSYIPFKICFRVRTWETRSIYTLHAIHPSISSSRWCLSFNLVFLVASFL